MKTYTYYPGSGYFTPFNIPEDVVRNCSHSGPCDEDINRAMELPEVQRELAKIDRTSLVRDLQEYGAWSLAELEDHTENLKRILWIACGHISDELHEQSKTK